MPPGEDTPGGIVKRLPTAHQGNQAVLLLHPYARKHSLPVKIIMSDNNAVLANDKGRKMPIQTRSNPGGSTSAVFVASAKGLGYQTLFLNTGAKESAVVEKTNQQTLQICQRLLFDKYQTRWNGAKRRNEPHEEGRRAGWTKKAGCGVLLHGGHNGDHFHNRMASVKSWLGLLDWVKPMDLRLNGKYTIKYAVWPHSGKLEEFEIADWAASLLLPPTAHIVKTGDGEAPLSKLFVGVKTNGIIPLSAQPDDVGSILRLMDVSGKQQPLKLELGSGLHAGGIRNLDGTKTAKVNPHKIVETRISRI